MWTEHVANHCLPILLQMLWWGVDEMLVELFARCSNASDYDGNPMDKFLASIRYEEYRPDETPQTIGLYGGQYIIFFSPGECGCPVMCISLIDRANQCL